MKIMDAHISKNTHTHVWEKVCKSFERCAVASKLRTPSLGIVTAIVQLVDGRQWVPPMEMAAALVVWNCPFLPPSLLRHGSWKGPKTQRVHGGQGNVSWRERATPSWGRENDLIDQVQSFDDFVWNYKPIYFNWSSFEADQRIFKDGIYL